MYPPSALLIADALPPAIGKGDVFVMRFILHDWSDSKAIKILQSVRNAIGAYSCAYTSCKFVTAAAGCYEYDLATLSCQ